MEKLHFLSGLPRSGSTLLANLLLQNPNFHCTHTSGCLETLINTRNYWNNIAEHKAHKSLSTKNNVLRAILTSYHQDIDRTVVFDKCRGWPSQIELVEALLSREVKLLITVRDLPDVLASFERLHRLALQRGYQPAGEFHNYAQMQFCEGRCDYLMRMDAPVGAAYNRTIDAISRGFRSRMFFVQYDALTTFPSLVMKAIYAFLKEPYFEHNFQYVEQITQEDDTVYGYPELHTIRNIVCPNPSKAEIILGPKLVEKYAAIPHFWKSSAENKVEA